MSDMAATPPSASATGVSHVDAAKALASLMQMIQNSSPVASGSNSQVQTAATQMNPYDFLQTMAKFSPAPFHQQQPMQHLDPRSEKEKKEARPSSEAYHPQPTRSGRVPMVPPSDEINMETFIDFPSESESDDPDFRPPRLAALKAAAVNSKGKGKAINQTDEDEEYIPESDTASGDEEILTAFTLAPLNNTSKDLPIFASTPVASTSANTMDFNFLPNDYKLPDEFWSTHLASPQMSLPPALPTTKRTTSIIDAFSSTAPTPRPSIAEAFGTQPIPSKPRPSIAEAFSLSSSVPTFPPNLAPPPSTNEEPPKRKRGRPRKASLTNEENNINLSSKKQKLDSVDVKKETTAERNRRNARLTQERKKKELDDLKSRVNVLEEENKSLRKLNEALMKDRLFSLGVALPQQHQQQVEMMGDLPVGGSSNGDANMSADGLRLWNELAAMMQSPR